MTEPGKGVVIPGFRYNRFLLGLLLWLVALWVAMENVLVFIYAILLIATYPRFRFSNLSYGLFGVFLSLHLVGAHYTYSETPFGFWLQEMFDLSRNHYDRIVHFSFGLLIAYPFREFLRRVTGMRVGWSYLFAVVTVLAFSGFYDGNPDVYVIPTLGGEPTRVTYHPGGDRVLDWTPDGEILFASGRETGIGRVNAKLTQLADGIRAFGPDYSS